MINNYLKKENYPIINNVYNDIRLSNEAETYINLIVDRTKRIFDIKEWYAFFHYKLVYDVLDDEDLENFDLGKEKDDFERNHL